MSGPNWCDSCGFYHPRDYRCEASRERDQSTRRLLDAERAAYQQGHAEGYREGYERGARLREADAVKIDPNVYGFAELELLRWGVFGREGFGDPRPADRYPAPKRDVA